MEFFDGAAAVPAGFGPSAVTIGKFDGVHLGHRAVLDQLIAAAAERDLDAVAVTFDRHPLALFSPENCPVPLVSNEQKLELLGESELAATLMLTFDRELAAQSPEQFVTEVLVDALGAKLVLAGEDFRFGAKAAGNIDTLRELGEQHGFEVQLIETVARGDDQRRVSSTWIRELLDAGRVHEAAELLGRPHRIRARVVHGEARGRELGFPTANLSPDIEGFRPADGVYATWAIIDGRRYPAATSIGNNPTFDGVPEHRIEAYLIDQSLDVYDRDIELDFVDYIRPMNRFDSVDELVAQLSADVSRIRTILAA